MCNKTALHSEIPSCSSSKNNHHDNNTPTSSSPPPQSMVPPTETDTPHGDNANTQLKVLYTICTSLCIFMIVWIMVIPGTWLHDQTKFHSTIIRPIMERYPGLAPANVITKYQEHYLVHFTHIAPGAIWCACIPFQLHSTFRRHYRTLHVRIGYVFLTTVLLMAIGVGVILKRKLFFEYFYQDVSTPMDVLLGEITLFFGTIWFVGTALYAIYCAHNNKKDILQHQIWIIRHVSSGMWIAIQRVFVIGIYPLTMYYNTPITRLVQRQAFSSSARDGYIISILLGEYAIYLLRQQQKQYQAKKKE